ncbi:tryptophan--tRNA ligase, mitochondrial [Elysia marginata]|uniref:Tryptophan--tRNA ligase, mitochondrial n=1 Tax=Elysia marginata TaxID=1093978 RepID=A0AAV4GRL1_9GAST|nr:tryptophan--tRNA ligase, mitochondrial [Elysia marginata]
MATSITWSRRMFSKCHRIFHRRKSNASVSFSTAKALGSASTRDLVFTGIQPTGVPHIGNYVGAISQMVRLQQTYKDRMLLSVVDLHALSIPQDPSLLRSNILDLTACLLACGIDPKHTILFQQSMVPHHTELAWILFCNCSVPRLQRMAQWKEKKATIKEPSVGLLTYPILQAADIMLYKSTLVPVGEDQTQHIELTRDLSRAFNSRYGLVFPECDMLAGEIPKIRSLRNPSNKMSKSEPSEKSRIELTDSPEVIAEKIKKAVTDFTSELTYDPVNRPGVSNLLDIHLALCDDIDLEDILEDSFLSAEDTGLYKQRLSQVVAEKLAPIRAEAIRLRADEGHLLEVLGDGADRASQIASETMAEVKTKLGLR